MPRWAPSLLWNAIFVAKPLSGSRSDIMAGFCGCLLPPGGAILAIVIACALLRQRRPTQGEQGAQDREVNRLYNELDG